MAAYIELENHVNAASVEYAYRRCQIEMQRNNQSFADVGLRAAKARDPKLLKVLDLAANVMVNLEENQRREQIRTSIVYGERRYTTETQMFREAYRTCDEGDPCPNLMWIYGAAALLAGFGG